MSRAIAVVPGPVDRDDAAAWRALDAALDEVGPATPRMRAFHDRLAAAFPCATAMSDAEADATSVWAEGPLQGLFEADHAFLPLRWTAFEAAAPAIIRLAHEAGLCAFDFGAPRQIHRGDGFHGMRLDVEGEPYLIAPRWDQVEAAVRGLSPDDGRGFLIIEADVGDYLQVAGGGMAFVVERREHGDGGFRHAAAGLVGASSVDPWVISVGENDITIPKNEALDAASVLRLADEFLNGCPRSAAFVWRDMTAMFG